MIGLAFDLGRTSGYAIGELTKGKPEFGHFEIEGETWGERAQSLASTVHELASGQNVAVVAYEMPVLMHASSLVLAGYAMMVEYMAAEFNIACTPVQNGFAKRVFAGKFYSKKIKPYPGCVEAERRGFKVTCTDEADALAIWYTIKAWVAEGRIETGRE